MLIYSSEGYAVIANWYKIRSAFQNHAAGKSRGSFPLKGAASASRPRMHLPHHTGQSRRQAKCISCDNQVSRHYIVEEMSIR